MVRLLTAQKSFVYTSSTICLHMQVQRSGTKVWSLGPCIKFDLTEITNHISRTFGHLFTSFDQDFQPIQLHRCAEAINEKSVALENCCGFIDGTVRPICRPTWYDIKVFAFILFKKDLKIGVPLGGILYVPKLYFTSKCYDMLIWQTSEFVNQQHPALQECFNANKVGTFLRKLCND